MTTVEIVTRMDELLAELPGTFGERRKQIVDELRLLNRRKLGALREGWDEDEWKPVPVVRYVQPADAPAPIELHTLLKLFLRLVVSGVEGRAAAANGEFQFVGLFTFHRDEDGLSLSLVCPYDEPRRFLMEALQGDVADRAAQLARVTTRELRLTCSFPENTTVPVVFSFSPETEHVLVTNQNHFSNPDQFLSPWLCRTTSGLLNFVGATNIRDSNIALVKDIEDVMNQGLDEWFRWLFCAMETGETFDVERLLVRKMDREEYVYAYPS
jgi:hypothetical protein